MIYLWTNVKYKNKISTICIKADSEQDAYDQLEARQPCIYKYLRAVDHRPYVVGDYIVINHGKM